MQKVFIFWSMLLMTAAAHGQGLYGSNTAKSQTFYVDSLNPNMGYITSVEIDNEDIDNLRARIKRQYPTAKFINGCTNNAQTFYVPTFSPKYKPEQEQKAPDFPMPKGCPPMTAEERTFFNTIDFYPVWADSCKGYCYKSEDAPCLFLKFAHITTNATDSEGFSNPILQKFLYNEAFMWKQRMGENVGGVDIPRSILINIKNTKNLPDCKASLPAPIVK